MAKAQQYNQYDKILQENLEAALPGLIKTLLGIEAVVTEELPDTVQHTKERKPDVLKRIIDSQEETFILHIEFQVKDEPDMIYRMAEYFIMLLRLYRLPVRQYVIFIGRGKPRMPVFLRSGKQYFEFNLLTLSSVDYRLLLKSARPEEKILAILGHFGKASPANAVAEITRQVVKASKGDFAVKRHIQQLRILAQLRNLAKENIDIMDSIAGYIKEENDFMYIRGIKKGQENIVLNLIRKSALTDSQIADIANVSIEYIQELKEKTAKK